MMATGTHFRCVLKAGLQFKRDKKVKCTFPASVSYSYSSLIHYWNHTRDSWKSGFLQRANFGGVLQFICICSEVFGWRLRLTFQFVQWGCKNIKVRSFMFTGLCRLYTAQSMLKSSQCLFLNVQCQCLLLSDYKMIQTNL